MSGGGGVVSHQEMKSRPGPGSLGACVDFCSASNTGLRDGAGQGGGDLHSFFSPGMNLR